VESSSVANNISLAFSIFGIVDNCSCQPASSICLEIMMMQPGEVKTLCRILLCAPFLYLPWTAPPKDAKHDDSWESQAAKTGLENLNKPSNLLLLRWTILGEQVAKDIHGYTYRGLTVPSSLPYSLITCCPRVAWTRNLAYSSTAHFPICLY
jgi:hypothetical protein